MRNRFEQQLQQLHRDLAEMGIFIGDTIDKTMSAFKTNNYTLAREVYESDDIADELEIRIERRSLRMLLFQQPVARDLRTISTALKIITDMERICGQTKNIAGIMLRFEGQELIERPSDITHMSEMCVAMVKESVNAFINNDVDLARAIISMDSEVDTLFWSIYNNTAPLVTQNPDKVMQAVDFLMMAKYYERIADHTVNIAEWVIFNITGEHKDKILL